MRMISSVIAGELGKGEKVDEFVLRVYREVEAEGCGSVEMLWRQRANIAPPLLVE